MTEKRAVYRVDQNAFDAFMTTLCEGRRVYALSRDDSQYHLSAADRWDPEKHVPGSYRPIEPLKSLFFPPRELISRGQRMTASESIPGRIVVGVKNCDLASLAIHDYVFRDTDPPDPYYVKARERTILVSCDCTDMLEVCFCPTVDTHPYPASGYDINLSPVGNAYVVEAGSDKGRGLLGRVSEYLKPADHTLLAKRDAARQALEERLRRQVAAVGLPTGSPDLRAAIEQARESALWSDFAKDCVECGACNFVCCTCHCFLLGDGQTKDDGDARVKKWDSCLYLNFARIAGGANPRPRRAERLRNRFEKKFSFFPQVLGHYACDGCGRCAEACTGRIDIREVLKRALNEC